MNMFAIKKYRMFDLPKHSKSTARFITDLLSFVDELLNKKKSVHLIPVPEKSVVEKPTNNPCKDLSPCDVVGQDTIRLSQAEFIELKSLSKSTTKSSTTTLGGATK